MLNTVDIVILALIGLNVVANYLSYIIIKKMVIHSVKNGIVTRFCLIRFYNDGISLCEYITEHNQSLLCIRWSKTNRWNKCSSLFKKTPTDKNQTGCTLFWKKCEPLGKTNVAITISWY